MSRLNHSSLLVKTRFCNLLHILLMEHVLINCRGTRRAAVRQTADVPKTCWPHRDTAGGSYPATPSLSQVRHPAVVSEPLIRRQLSTRTPICSYGSWSR